MIYVKLNESDFEYDLYSLFKAFYPEENLLVTAEEKEPAEPVSFYTEVLYAENQIACVFYDSMEKKREEDRKVIDVDYVNLSTLAPGPTPRSIDQEKRKDTKNRLKRLIYQMLSQRTGEELPWGTLTGIRPTKVAMSFFDGQNQSCSDISNQIRNYMKSTYLTSDEKIETSIRVAGKEHELLSAFDYKKGYSLYIGIPFCPTRCAYCSFTAYPISMWQNKVDDYLNALKKELSFIAESQKSKPLHTIYMGGGTPTTLTGAQFDELFSFIEEHFDLTQLREFTVEGGRPDSITEDNLLALKRHNVSRISINPQTMNQKTLDLIGRHHTVEQIANAFTMARSFGFDNINMDLILGLPEEGDAELRHTLEEVGKLNPDSLTVHSLALKRAARLNTEREDFKKYRMTNSNERMHFVEEYAKIHGLEPYYLYRQKNMTGNLENVGYSRPGKEGLYNILIMEEKQTIISVGAGGLTKIVEDGRPRRVENVKDVATYLERIDEMIERKRIAFTNIES